MKREALGNHVKYEPLQNWIRALGPLIVKLHVKDFKLNEDGYGGKVRASARREH